MVSFCLMRSGHSVVRPILLFVLAVFLVLPAFPGTIFADEDAEKDTIVNEIVRYVKNKNIKLSEDGLRQMASTVYDESKLRDVDYRLALAVIRVESNFRQDAVSRRGARGLFQIKPALAKYIAKDVGVSYKSPKCLDDPENNIKLGVYHLSRLMDDFESTVTALHAYNVGHNKVKKKLFNYGESSSPFTKRVLKEYDRNVEVLPDPE